MRFLTRGKGYTLFLTSTEAVVALDRGQHTRDRTSRSLSDDLPAQVPRDVLRMKMVNGRADAEIEGLDELTGRVSYVRGLGESQSRQDVRSYARVRYHGVYPGIDLVYYGNQGALEYDFDVAPGADPADHPVGIPGRDGRAAGAERRPDDRDARGSRSHAGPGALSGGGRDSPRGVRPVRRWQPTTR